MGKMTTKSQSSAKRAYLNDMEVHVPQLVSNEELELGRNWSFSRFAEKVGIRSRSVSESDVFASDLGFSAAAKLLGRISTFGPIDQLIVVTQTPDLVIPQTASLIHERLGLPQECAVFDINQGCSGFPLALNVAAGLVESGRAERVLLITTDTYSKIINPNDMTLRPIFGDGASASLVSAEPVGLKIGNVSFGSDGTRAGMLVAPGGGMRNGASLYPWTSPIVRELEETGHDLFMDGQGIFQFTSEITEFFVEQVLETNHVESEDIDFYVFHQANSFILEHLRIKLGISRDKFVVEMSETGNLVSTSIPHAIHSIRGEGKLENKVRLVLFGFGVGLSWSGTVLEGSLS